MSIAHKMFSQQIVTFLHILTENDSLEFNHSAESDITILWLGKNNVLKGIMQYGNPVYSVNNFTFYIWKI